MTKVLLTLGDSWPEGAELGAGRRFGEIIRDAMAFDEFFNFGSGGASNEDLLYQFQDYVENHWREHHNTTAIFFLTNPARSAHFPRFFPWDHASPDLKQLYLHFHKPSHEIMRYSSAIAALQHWCDRLQIKDFYFAGWVRYHQWAGCVDVDRIWCQGRETAADWFGAANHNGEHLLDVSDNIYIKPNFAHPNQLGHDLIAQRLMTWIQTDAR